MDWLWHLLLMFVVVELLPLSLGKYLDKGLALTQHWLQSRSFWAGVAAGVVVELALLGLGVL